MARAKVHEKFVEYQNRIAVHPNYQGMPDLWNSDGSIQWEAPSNRAPSSRHAETHVKRLEWWRKRAMQEGISISEEHWISKTAKKIHPTGEKPCKVCGHLMKISYVYPTCRALNRLNKYPELNDVATDRFATVYDIAAAIYEHFAAPGEVLQTFLKNKAWPKILQTDDALIFENWLANEYVPSEPKGILSPGAMSNAPDRLDGFHSFNLCCRSTSDKGRSKENLSSYASDRRAFENWSEGNWVTANLLMGEVRKSDDIQSNSCANNANHQGVITADHIGPISLGFAHRPVFRLLCASCNSAKNNRMTIGDVDHLRKESRKGIDVCSWYNQDLWDLASPNAVEESNVGVLNRLLRDNRSIAFEVLGVLQDQKLYFAMASLLNPEFAAMKWTLESFQIHESVLTAQFSSEFSTAKYRKTQQERMLRVSFEAISEYLTKENRNSAAKLQIIQTPSHKSLVESASRLNQLSTFSSEIINRLIDPLGNSEIDVEHVVEGIEQVKGTEEYASFMDELSGYMNIVAIRLMESAANPRYVRDIDIAWPGSEIRLDSGFLRGSS